MAQRYVRVQSLTGRVSYGILQVSRVVTLLDAAPWLSGQPTGAELATDEYTILAPCVPSKVIAVGKNYRDHAIEMGTDPPKEPLIFLKPPTAVIADGSNIQYPEVSNRIDYEGELALVIGEQCVKCDSETALSKIWGYTIANDVTARDLQMRDGQWTRAKGFDTFCPLGPWIVREVSPGAKLQTFLNDRPEPLQSSTIDQMVFSPEQVVAFISQVMTLLPGDVVLTGTPAGVGPMAVGDQVRVEIEGIGSLTNTVTLSAGPKYQTSSERSSQALETLI